MSVQKEVANWIQQFSVQRTLFMVMYDEAQKLEKKYRKEGLTDDEMTEYDRLAEDLGSSQRGSTKIFDKTYAKTFSGKEKPFFPTLRKEEPVL